MTLPPLDDAELRRRVWQDVVWLGTAPALVSDEFWQSAGVHGVTCAPWRSPTLAQVFPSPQESAWWRQKHRLGHHFEHVHAELLRVQPQVVVHALNLAIRSDGHTLGELDCLYSEASGVVVHREIAVKYYLGFCDSSAASNWIGTGKVDRLDLKLERMARHQTQLSVVAQQAEAWPAALPFPTRREVFMSGAFFKHPDHQSWPACMGPHAERGFWCTTREFLAHAPESLTWAVLSKPWWLSAAHLQVMPTALASEVAARVEAAQEPQFVGSLGGSFLQGRGFVVPESWV